MSKARSKHDPDLRDEYDFSDGVRGKYAHRLAEGSNVVLLDPDVAKEFPDSAAVNDALRLFLAGGRAHAPVAKAGRPRGKRSKRSKR